MRLPAANKWWICCESDRGFVADGGALAICLDASLGWDLLFVVINIILDKLYRVFFY